MSKMAYVLGCVAAVLLLTGLWGCESQQKSGPSQYDHIPTAAEARAETTPPKEANARPFSRFFKSLWPFKKKPPVQPIAATIYRFEVVDPHAKTWERRNVQSLRVDFETDEGVFTDVDGIEYPQVFYNGEPQALEDAVDNREWIKELPRRREGVNWTGRTFYELVVHQDDEQPDLRTVWGDPDLPGMASHGSQQISERLIAYVHRLVHPMGAEINLLQRRDELVAPGN